MLAAEEETVEARLLLRLCWGRSVGAVDRGDCEGDAGVKDVAVSVFVTWRLPRELFRAPMW